VAGPALRREEDATARDVRARSTAARDHKDRGEQRSERGEEADGLGEVLHTVEGIVKNQIDNPRPSIGNPASYMPPHIVEGKDADDIAAYVGKYAGVPGAAPPEVAGGEGGGAQVFANSGCGNCHTLAAAGSTGTQGPDLDQLEPSQATVEKQVTKGGGLMPAFGNKLSKKEIEEVGAYVAESTHK